MGFKGLEVMRKIFIYGLLVGVIVTLSAWVMGGLPNRLFFSGFFISLASYLCFVVTLYVKKIDVLSRGGWIKFEQQPWSYRSYFLVILFPWFILTMLVMSAFMEYLLGR